MRYLSLFSGLEGATLAWHHLGECAAVSEIEPAACAVLAAHYPDVPNLGDISKVTEQQIQDLGHIDIVVFGSPCQDVSIAGKREGMEGSRSGLFFTAMRVVRWSGARFALWENVPGVFSDHQGRGFASVVGEMAGIHVDVPKSGWRNSGFLLGADALVEWAVLDAQFFGVPQRRRRVFALRDSGDWASRPPILLEPESLQGHPAPRRESGQVAPTIPARSLGGGGLGSDFDCDGGGN
jgi:DNA (cytosine-5)-methyltransferase 1